MPDFTRLDKNQIFQPLKISSNAESKEAMSEIFSKVGKATLDTAIEMNNEKSNASLYQATNQLYRLKEISHKEMMENPDQALYLAGVSKDTANNILNNVPLNKSDRQKLEYLANNDVTDIETNASKINTHYAKTQGTINFALQFPEKLQQIQNSIGDEKSFQINVENAQKVINDAVLGGFIDQKQAQTYYKALNGTLEKVKYAHQIAVDESKHTAENVHKVASKIHKTNNFHQVGLPIDENTRSVAYERSNQFNAQDITASLVNDGSINPLVMMNLSPHKQQEIMIQYGARSEIQAKINSGASWQELKHEQERLNSESDKVLSTSDRFKKTYLDSYFKKYEKDDFLREMGNFGEGARLSNDHNIQVKAFMNDQSLSPEQKELQIREINNQFTSNMVAIGMAHDVPSNMIKPIHSSEISKVEQSFNAGGDPMNVLRTVDYYNDRNKVYVSAAIKDPVQKEVVYQVGNLVGHTDNGMRADLVSANQKGIDFKPLQLGKDGTPESRVRLDVANDPRIKEINDYNRRFKSGTERTTSMIDMTTNVVKYQSMKNQDFPMKNYQSTVNKWGREYAKGYDIKKGSYYQFNKKQQPQINDHEWDMVANYAREEAYTAMKSDPKYSNADFMQSIDTNPLYVTITPDNYIVTMDQNSNVLYSHYFSTDMVHMANKVKNEKEKSMKTDIGLEGYARAVLR